MIPNLEALAAHHIAAELEQAGFHNGTPASAGSNFHSSGAPLNPTASSEFALSFNPISLDYLLFRIERFQTRAFPGQTLAGKLKHLVKEAGELRDNPGDPHEWADVLLLLLGALPLATVGGQTPTFDDLLRFAHEKMTINEARDWHPADADGCFHHKK